MKSLAWEVASVSHEEKTNHSQMLHQASFLSPPFLPSHQGNTGGEIPTKCSEHTWMSCTKFTVDVPREEPQRERLWLGTGKGPRDVWGGHTFQAGRQWTEKIISNPNTNSQQLWDDVQNDLQWSCFSCRQPRVHAQGERLHGFFKGNHGQ